MAANSGRISKLVVFDLSAAFNTTDHDVFIERPESTFGINRNMLQFLLVLNLIHVIKTDFLQLFSNSMRQHY